MDNGFKSILSVDILNCSHYMNSICISTLTPTLFSPFQFHFVPLFVSCLTPDDMFVPPLTVSSLSSTAYLLWTHFPTSCRFHSVRLSPPLQATCVCTQRRTRALGLRWFWHGCQTPASRGRMRRRCGTSHPRVPRCAETHAAEGEGKGGKKEWENCLHCLFFRFIA